jgi:hypothetical protein
MLEGQNIVGFRIGWIEGHAQGTLGIAALLLIVAAAVAVVMIGRRRNPPA